MSLHADACKACVYVHAKGGQCKMKAAKNTWVLLVMILSGIVLGGFIGMLAEGVTGLSWLSYGQSFGLESPIVLDLGILVLTFGITINISVASILGIVIAIIIYRKL